MESNERKKFLRLDRRFLFGIVIGLVLAGAGIGIVAATGAYTGDAGEIEDIAPGAISVTDQEARDAVLEAYPDMTVTEVDLDTQSDGTLVYDVGLSNGKEVMVNARTGEILGFEVDDDDSGDDNDDD